jgi:antibiotic biosynthesis monooxygenase (ABM) superfamily enzyme
MYIRCAFFEGRVKPGCDHEFASFVKEKLVPLWTQFPGAIEVRVLRQHESDTVEPHYAMVLAIKYPSLAAIDEAMKSDVRAQSREVTGELVKMFEGRIFHTVFEAAHDEALL